jgi:hypothetical protein
MWFVITVVEVLKNDIGLSVLLVYLHAIFLLYTIRKSLSSYASWILIYLLNYKFYNFYVTGTLWTNRS